MATRASHRAVQTLFLVVALAAADNAPVSAQSYQPLLYAYGELMRPLRYMRGRASPYVLEKADFFGGIDAAKATTFAWAGVTYAPFGKLIDDGWRVRFMGGAGLYSYQTGNVPGGINSANVFSAELLGGYRKTFSNVLGQSVYIGAFAGINYEDQLLHLSDPFNPTRGAEAGVKGSLEIYSRIHQRYIASAFGTASTVHQKYNAKASLLYEINETWALGGEIATMGDARYSEYRAGVVGSLTWQKRIFVLSAGALDNSGRGTGAYTTFSVYSPF